MRLLAEQGGKATTIRAVAEAAGVTPGLVSHHFGSKEGLRDACDAHVLEYLRGGIREAIDQQGLGDPAYLRAAYQQPPVRTASHPWRARWSTDRRRPRRYSTTSSRSPRSTWQPTHHRRSSASMGSDPRAQAAVLIAMRLGMWVLHDHLVRALGADTLTPTCCRGSARPWWTSCRRTSPVRNPVRPGPPPAWTATSRRPRIGVNMVNLEPVTFTGAQEGDHACHAVRQSDGQPRAGLHPWRSGGRQGDAAHRLRLRQVADAPP